VYSIDMLNLTTEKNAVLLSVKVIPGASRTRFLGELDGRARISLAAPDPNMDPESAPMPQPSFPSTWSGSP